MAERVDNQSVEIGLLVAGGRSLRAGLDKRCLVLEGRTLLVRNVAFLRELFPTVAVVIGHDQRLDLGDAGPVEMLRDEWPGGSPLAGLATALAQYGRPVFALAADIAFPSRTAAQSVITAFSGHDVAMPTLGPERRQPLFAAYGPACLEPMSAVLDAGRHRIVHILSQVRLAEVRVPDESAFRNINTIADFAAVRTEAAGRSSAGAVPQRPALIALSGSLPAERTRFLDRLTRELERLGAAVAVLREGEGAPVTALSGASSSVDLLILEENDALPWRIRLTTTGDTTTPWWSVIGPHADTIAPRTEAMLASPPADIPTLACFLALRLDSLRNDGGGRGT